MGEGAGGRHRARLRRVLVHIETHLDGDLRAEVLSGVAALSRFHFHRQFAAAFGIGPHRYVQLLRLKRAAYRLAFRPQVSVAEIALDAGYEGPEAFCRAFKQRLGQTPSGFRVRPHWRRWQAVYDPAGETRERHMKQDHRPEQVGIVNVPGIRVAMLEHRGDPALLGDTIRRFIAWRREAGLPPWRSATYNILHGDPRTTPPEEFRLGLCAATERAVPPNAAGVVPAIIPGGRCGMLRHVGGEESFAAAIAYLCADWLPRSGEARRGIPLFCRRVSFFPDVPEHEAVTEIFLPLK